MRVHELVQTLVALRDLEQVAAGFNDHELLKVAAYLG